ncbi:hypothetical protein ANO14919_129560 [Xylariales sp. No.14919]|nr:hypothetical protein ANO14919_129560 [Xylariales sp. No.14919]
MSTKSSFEIPTEPMGPQPSNNQLWQTHMNNKYLRGDGEMAIDSSSSSSTQDVPSENDAQSLEAREQHHSNELHDQKCHPPSSPRGAASKSIRSTNLANCTIWSETPPDPARTYDDKPKQPTVYCPRAPINESQQIGNANTPGLCSPKISRATAGAITNASLPGPRPNGVIPSIELSLRGGGGEASPAPHKQQHITFPRFRGRPTTSSSRGLSPATADSSNTAPGIVPVATFKHLPKPARAATRMYLKGELAAHLAVGLRMPLDQTLAYLRYAVLLLLEAESPLLRATLRSAAAHARFREGLSPSLLLPDSDFVAGLRADNPRLDDRLRRWRERSCVLWALQTVGFPELMRGVGDVEEKGEEGRAMIDASGLGDLDMRL